jgi:hypothetical protein
VGLAALPGLLLSAIFRDPEGCGTAEATRVWELMSMASQDAYVRGAGDETVPDCTSCAGTDAAVGPLLSQGGDAAKGQNNQGASMAGSEAE